MIRRLILALVVGTAALVGLSAPLASAHNSLETSDPVDGATVGAISVLTLDFVKDVPLDTVSVTLIQPDGSRVDLTGITNGATADIVLTPLPTLVAGEYTARWRLVGADGHVVTDRVDFTVVPDPNATTVPTASTLPPTPTPAPLVDGGAGFDPPAWIGWLFRYGSYLALMVLAGVAVTEAFVWRDVATSRRVRVWANRALAGVVVGALGQWVLLAGALEGRGPWSEPGGLTIAAEHPVGMSLVIRIVLAFACWVLVVRERPETRQHYFEVVALLSAAMLATWSFAGHSRSMRWPWLGVPLDAAHHAAAAAWLGGLLIVGVHVLRVPRRDTGPVAPPAALRRFSRIAALSVGVLVATGVVQAVRLDGGPGAILSGTHGRLLLVKVALLAPMLWLANANRRRLRVAAGGADTESDIPAVQRAIRAEFVLGLAILAVTASLVVTPPSSDQAAAQPLTPTTCSTSTPANGAPAYCG